MIKKFFAANYKKSKAFELFSSLEKVFALDAKPISQDQQSDVLRINIDDKIFYVKRYYRHNSFLRRHMIKSRCTTEFVNLRFVASLNIPTPEIVAYQQTSLLGRLFKGRAYLVTAEVTDSQNLAEIADHAPEKIADHRWRLAVIYKLADYLKRLHKKHFVHGDLNWRNILVAERYHQVEVFFFDMPLARRRYDPSLRHFLLKDLAMLDRKARECFSRSDRLRFYLRYCGKNKLTTQDKRYIVKIQDYINRKQRLKDLKHSVG